MRQIFIGTSGYSYNDWYGYFYPATIKKNKMLEYYAEEFPFTEINSTYYRLPSPHLLKQMAQKTPKDFIFTVKAYKSLTHERPENIAEDTKKFNLALEPLLETKKLGAVLLQFPYSFHNQEENRHYLAFLRQQLKDIPITVEFRHYSWVRKATWEFLRSLNLGYVCIDAPKLKGLIGSEIVCTAEVAYIRFHGRNAAKWWKHEQAYERYDYLYSKEEIQEWLPGIKKLSDEARRVFVAFNNHYRGQAVQNARLLRELLSI